VELDPARVGPREGQEAGVDLLVTQAVRDELEKRLRAGKTVDVALKGKTGSFVLHEVRGLDPS
jgi:hypothetical protein